MAKKPEQFTDSQWALCRKYNAAVLFSSICGGFGPQFFLLYIMQNIDMQAKALQSMAVTATGMASAMVVVLPWVMKRLDKWIIPQMWFLAFLGIGCDLILIQHPTLVLFIMATVIGFMDAFVDGGFQKLSNRVFQGDAKTVYTFMNRRAAMVGVCVSSVLCYICANVPLIYIIYTDIVLTVIDSALITLRVGWMKKELKSMGMAED